MTKVLVACPVPPPFGGIASVAEDLIHSELSTEFDFTLFPRSELFPPGVEGFWAVNMFRLRRFIRFFRLLRGGGFSLLHVHSAQTNFRGSVILMMLARAVGTKVLLHLHGSDWNSFYGHQSAWNRLLKRWCLRLPDRIIILNALWEKNLNRLQGPVPVVLVRNRLAQAAPPDPKAVAETRARLGLDVSHFVVLLVGGVSETKGVFEILEAAPEVIRNKDTVRFVLVGREELPGEMRAVKSIIRAKGLHSWVQITGEVERDKVPLLMGMADLFLLPSRTEGMPVALLEAMRARLPIVATSVGGIPEMVEDGVSGLVIEPQSPEQITRAILRLVDDEAFRHNLGEGGYKAFEEKFEYSKGVEEMRAVYRSLIAKD